eukprot:TRINITY_DN88657_c0_g1_i1.p1 TRINITY_DN88657_c0_g1~~TRINITY_DN88657_c0_g1_i1.p1  ORF type:complete len:221 (-),score=44.46 TRINITY_DN88657_c0_g1_i1:13-675(-)
MDGGYVEQVPAGGEDVGKDQELSVEYRVLQGPLFKKPSKNPASQKVIGLSRKVGSKVSTTGKTWTGPSGGVWVELDPSKEKLGWLLIEGPGFNQPGPLLELVEPGEEEPIVLFALSPIDDSPWCDICLKPSQTVRHAKHWLALRMPGLQVEKMMVAREKPSGKTHGQGLRNFPATWLITDEVRIRDTPFKNNGELVFFYMGDAAEDVAEFKAKAKSGEAT